MTYQMLTGMAVSAGLLLTGHAAAAQSPRTHSQTSVVQRVAPDSTHALVTGRMRELKCRGKPGIDMQVHQDPSPRLSDHVTMVLRYERLQTTHPLRQVGMVSVDDGVSVHFQPGGCTWGGAPGDGFLSEPRIVYFDLPRDAQKHAAPGARDTTIEVAAHFPDVRSLPRYMSDSSRYWVFYVDDATNVSISFGRWPLGGAPAPAHEGVAGSLRDARPGSATLSSARVLPSDSAARTLTVVRTPAPAPAPAASGTVGGPLRDKSPGTATVAGARPLPTDSAARRTAAVRTATPTPTATGARPLRGASPGAVTPSTSRVMPTDTAPKVPDDARAETPQLRVNRVYDVRTAPGPNGVRLTFNATGAGSVGNMLGVNIYNPTGGIRVQFSRTRPSWDDRERQWFYPDGLGGPWFERVHLADGGGFVAEPDGKLTDGERYYYLITVFGSDRSAAPGQRTGSFTADVRASDR